MQKGVRKVKDCLALGGNVGGGGMLASKRVLLSAVTGMRHVGPHKKDLRWV